MRSFLELKNIYFNRPSIKMTLETRTKKTSKSECVKVPPRRPKVLLGYRHVQVLLLTCGFMCSYIIRVNMSVALVAMVNSSVANPSYQEFDWNESTQGLILSSFFWGYVITQIPGGMIAQRWGAKQLFGFSVVIAGLVSMVTPLAAYYGGWQAVCLSRIIAGFCQGAIVPVIQTLLAKWVPPEERSRLGTLVYASSLIGSVIALMSSGVLAASSFGWPSIFYIDGSLTFLCGLVWFFLGRESPSNHPSISLEEKDFIEISLGVTKTNETLSTPWRAILTSLPVWALLCTHIAQGWGLWMLITETPSYVNSVLNFDIKQNGLISALPYLVAWIFSFPISFVSDILVTSGYVRLITMRKICNSLGEWIPGVTLICLGYVDNSHSTLAVVLLIATVGFNVSIYCGYQVNHIDLSPNFAGIVMGITNCVSNICGILAPLVASIIITDSTDVLQWRILFFITAGFYILGNLMFVLFGSAEVQKWNDPITRTDAEIPTNRSSAKKNDQEKTR